ncbi:MAG: hypothetical protein J5J00_01640 [Deltaproteobacteria bacterium]|nr:hypothetical protein [Deltaproteobacteria bacterium]
MKVSKSFGFLSVQGVFKTGLIKSSAVLSLLALSCAVSIQPSWAENDEANLGSLYRDEFVNTTIRLPRPEPRQGDSQISISILELDGGTQVTLHAPNRWKQLAGKLLKSLKSTHEGYASSFGEIPQFKTALKLMDEDTFYRSTGAPSWTNALYYKGQILIPLGEKSASDFDNISRSIRHEYTHAVVNALSNGRCPGWLDEGLAQWAEGDENPALKPALVHYLRKNPPVSLSMLQNGFTRLETRIVPAAYAQSLYATNGLIETHGFNPIGAYLRGLGSGLSKNDAFKEAFQIDESAFEKDLSSRLTKWVRHAHRHEEHADS